MYIYHEDAFDFDKSSDFYKDYKKIATLFPFELIRVDSPKKISELSLQTNFLKINNKLALSSKIEPLKDAYVASVLESFSESEGDLDIVDFREEVENEAFLYGNRSMVLERVGGAAFCGINDLSDEDLFLEYCEEFELYPIDFLGDNRYFTHQYILITSKCVFICKDFIKDKKCLNLILSHFKKHTIEVVFISIEQVERNVLNMVEIRLEDEDIVIITQQSFDVLTLQQQKILCSHFSCKVVDLPFFEKENIFLRDIIS